LELFKFQEKRIKTTIRLIRKIKQYNKNVDKVLFLGKPSMIEKCLKDMKIINPQDIQNTSFDLREHFPIRNNKYDLVICTETLEHLKDRNTATRDMFDFSGVYNVIREAFRILKKNGLFFVTTPNGACLKSICRLLLYKSPYMWIHHIKEYSPNQIKYMLEVEHFYVKKMKTYNLWPEYNSEQPIDSEFNINWDVNELILSNFLKQNNFDTGFRDDSIFFWLKKHLILLI
jgi:SAM-dependent methyltransferase